MPRFTYEVAGQQAVIDVADELAPFHRAQPGYTEVVSEEAAAELKGADLEAAVEAANIPHPSGLKADEKRAALVDATRPDKEN